MSKIPQISGKELIAVLNKKGFKVIRILDQVYYQKYLGIVESAKKN